MLRVPEGEAILIVFPDQTAWLVDGGNTNRVADNANLATVLQAHLEGPPRLTLRACVASHSHIDHIGALETLLASGSPALDPDGVRIYRGTGAWNRGAAFLNRYHDMVSDEGLDERIFAARTEEIVSIGDHTEAHFFVGTGTSAYASLWMRLRYKSALLLFTGDSHQPYERNLIRQFSAGHFRADVLKVTHHGSSSGTSEECVAATRPAFAITSSTQSDDDHRLEDDTRDRIIDVPDTRRRIFNTDDRGDIVLRTDGEAYGDGAILYQVT